MATPVLYGPDGRPIERDTLKRAISGATLAGVRSPTGSYPADGLTPSRLAAVMRAADAGHPFDYFDLAELIEERDLHYLGVLGTRKRSVAQIPIRVEAASDDATHVKHADLIRTWLTRDELQDEIFDILDGIGKGISFTEIIWDSSMGQWRPERLEYRVPRWFHFDRADLETPLLREIGGDVPLPPFKFIVGKFKAKSGLSIRSGIARVAAWAWMFKAFTQKDWAIFSQVFGQPVRIGKYKAGATEAEKDTLYDAVANIAADCAAIIPESMSLEFVESKTVQQSADIYRQRCDWLDQQVSKAVLGQTATTDAIAGGHAVGQEHRKVQEDITRADAKQLASILNRDLVRPWIDLEFGPQQSYPRLVIEEPDETDIPVLSDALTKLVPLGLKVSMAQVRDKLGLDEPDEAEPVLGTLPAPAPFKAELQATAPVRQDAVDKLVPQADAVAAPGMDAMIKAVRDLLDEAASLEDVRDGLLKLYPKMPEAQVADAMRLALAFAELSGRSDGA